MDLMRLAMMHLAMSCELTSQHWVAHLSHTHTVQRARKSDVGAQTARELVRYSIIQPLVIARVALFCDMLIARCAHNEMSWFVSSITETSTRACVCAQNFAVLLQEKIRTPSSGRCYGQGKREDYQGSRVYSWCVTDRQTDR